MVTLPPSVRTKTSSPLAWPDTMLVALEVKATLVPSPLMVDSPLFPSPAAPALEALRRSVFPAPAGSSRA